MSRHSPEHSKPGEMAALVRDKDWSKTQLGTPDTWSPSFTLTVNLMLVSGFPMAVRWGPDFVMIYNDGYRPILGEKHPKALGLPFRETWPEVQSTLGPLHGAILAGDSGAFFAEDLLLKIQRYGTDWEDARFTVSYSPIPDDTASTGIGGVLITAVETTGRVRTEKSLRASEERFGGIFRQTSVGIVQCDLEGRFLLVNNRYCEITGRTEAELASLQVADVTHPDDRHESGVRLRRLAVDGVPFVVEKRYLRPDGSQVWVTNNVALTRTRDGKPQNFIAVVQDITESKRAQEQQKLLLRELNHRVKNLFAVANGMVALSARTATTPKELATNIRGRLSALAFAHEIILPHGDGNSGATDKSTSLNDLVEKILSPYLDGQQDGAKHDRLVVEGPAVAMGARSVTSLALILHELATNAAKYGALSIATGGVRIEWSELNGTLLMKWSEHGGPAIAGPPSIKGFGTVLSDHSVRGQFDGTLSYAWLSTGLVVELSLPMERLSR